MGDVEWLKQLQKQVDRQCFALLPYVRVCIRLTLPLYTDLYFWITLIFANETNINITNYRMFTLMLPSINFCRLNLLIILNQNLPIRDKNDYNFRNILVWYSVLIRFIMKSTCNQQFNIKYKHVVFIIVPVNQLGKVKMNALWFIGNRLPNTDIQVQHNKHRLNWF